MRSRALSRNTRKQQQQYVDTGSGGHADSCTLGPRRRLVLTRRQPSSKQNGMSAMFGSPNSLPPPPPPPFSPHCHCNVVSRCYTGRVAARSFHESCGCGTEVVAPVLSAADWGQVQQLVRIFGSRATPASLFPTRWSEPHARTILSGWIDIICFCSSRLRC